MNAILVAVAGSLLTVAGTAAPASRAQIVEIIGGEYSFRVPPVVHAGPTTFYFTNRGKVRHELSISLLRAGVTLQQYMAARAAKAHPGQLLEVSVGALFAAGGGRDVASLGTMLLAGRDYLVICDRKDSLGAPEHSMLGMFTSIHVTGAPDSPAVAAPADTVVGSDYAFRHPDTLRAGRHRFAFVNAGTHRHELKFFLLPQGQTLKAFMTEHDAWRANRKSGGSAPSAAIAVLTGGPGITPLGVVEIDLAPEREYALTCDFSDTPDAPPHTSLGMFGSIRVIGRRR
jgi:hypothetical protein